MVRPPLSHQDTQLLSFIDEFLFDTPSPSLPLSPRLQRSPSKVKPYRSLWRSAAKYIIKKRYPLQEPHSPRLHDVWRKLPPAPAAKLRFDCCERGSTGAPQHDTHDNSCRIDVDLTQGPRAAEVGAVKINVTPSSLNTQHANTVACHVPDTSSQLSTDSRAGLLTQKVGTSSIHSIPKHSSRKPPRPPRTSMSRSGSYRAVRLKTSTRRAAIENSRMKKKQLPKSASSASTVWALIITFCFVFIMLVQGFLGNSYKAMDSKIESPSAWAVLSPNMDTSSIEKSTRKHLSEHGAREGWQQSRSNLFLTIRRGLGLT